MLVESYSMASLSKIVEDLTEIYVHSKEISSLKPEIENPKYNILQGIARGTLDSISLLADYYIEEFDKGIASLKADKPTRFFLDRLYDISKEATELSDYLEPKYTDWYNLPSDIQEIVNKFYHYTSDLHLLYLISEPLENRYFFGNYDYDQMYNAAKITRSGNFLLYDGKKIEMNSKSREYKVVKYLFEKAIDKTVDFDEIEEFFDNNADFISNDNSSYYHACRRINNKVFSEFRIEDFLKFDTRTVSIKNLQE